MTLDQKITAEIDAAKAIKAAAAAQNRDMTDEETTQMVAHLDAADALKAEQATADEEAARAESVAQARADAASRLARADADLNKPKPRRVPPAPAVAREGFLSDPKRGFAHMGDLAIAIHGHGNVAAEAAHDARLRSLAAATGLNQTVGAEGGFAVPPAFKTEIWDGLNQDGVSLLDLVDKYDITGSESLTIPAVAETSRANGSRFGGVRAYWLAEAAQQTGSKPTLRQVKVEPHGLAALCYITDKLLKNASALGSYLMRAAPSEVRFVTNDAIINGTGTGQPKGILTSGSIVSVAKETSQAAATVVTENVVKMMARLHPNLRQRGEWLANIDIEPQLMLASISIRNVAGSDNVGGSSVPIYNPAAGTLMGRPIRFVEGCATLGTTGDLIFWDPKSYVAAVYGDIQQDASMHLRFDYAETAFRFLFYVDGQPYLASALTPFKGSTTLSSHVKLDTRS